MCFETDLARTTPNSDLVPQGEEEKSAQGADTGVTIDKCSGNGHESRLAQKRQLQEQAVPVFDKLSPEQRQKLSDEVIATLYMLIDADMKAAGEVSAVTLEVIASQGYSYIDGQLAKQGTPIPKKRTELQRKAAEAAKEYQKLPLREKLKTVAQAFGYASGKIGTSPCSGKWRGTSDIFIRFDNGASLHIGNQRTADAKIAKVQNRLVDAILAQYNPEIVAATKETALAALKRQMVKDNEIAAQKGLKPYILLNVELNDGTADESGGYMGWYYVTLAVDGKIRAHIETGLTYEIASGKVDEMRQRKNYYAACGLKEADIDYIFNNVGFSSASDLYTIHISESAQKRAEKKLAELEQTPPAVE